MRCCAGHEIDMFIIELGVRQGGSKSPLLFNLYNVEFFKLKYSIPKSAFVSNSPFGEYGGNMFKWIDNEDDLVLAFANRENLFFIIKNFFLKLIDGGYGPAGKTNLVRLGLWTKQ